MTQLLWCWICWYTILFVNAAPRIEMDRRKAVVNLPLTITCISNVAITSSVVFRVKPSRGWGGCSSTGSCGAGLTRYRVGQNKEQRTTTFTITHVNSTVDNGTWFCNQEGEGDSGDLPITQFATVLDWNSLSFNPSLSSLPSSVTPQQTVTVTVITLCADPQAVFTWKYQQEQGVSGSPPSSTSTAQTSCPPGQVQTINTLSLPGNTPSLFNKQIFLTVSVEHDSFDPPTYKRSANSSSIQFPVPVTSVTMQEISSDNEKVFWPLGTELTLTCVTSPGLPAPTVNWSGLPSQITVGNTIHATSIVHFIMKKSDHGRTVWCTASNIDGQTSPQSYRAVLEVQSPPLSPTNVRATAVGPTSLVIKWTSNQNGGDTQIFHLQFRSSANNWINTLENGIPDPGEDFTASTEVSGLQASTRYSFTIFSINVYGSSQKVELNVTTTEAATTTQATEKRYTPSSFSEGLIASVVVNVCLLALLILGLVLFFLCRRGILKKPQCLKRRQNADQRSVNPPSTSELPAVTSGPYSELDHINSAKKTYCELKVAEYEETSPYEN